MHTIFIILESTRVNKEKEKKRKENKKRVTVQIWNNSSINCLPRKAQRALALTKLNSVKPRSNFHSSPELPASLRENEKFQNFQRPPGKNPGIQSQFRQRIYERLSESSGYGVAAKFYGCGFRTFFLSELIINFEETVLRIRISFTKKIFLHPFLSGYSDSISGSRKRTNLSCNSNRRDCNPLLCVCVYLFLDQRWNCFCKEENGAIGFYWKLVVDD